MNDDVIGSTAMVVLLLAILYAAYIAMGHVLGKGKDNLLFETILNAEAGIEGGSHFLFKSTQDMKNYCNDCDVEVDSEKAERVFKRYQKWRK